MMRNISTPLARALFALLAIVVLTLSVSLKAIAAIPEPPNPPALVTDFAQMLDEAQRTNLERKLSQYAALHGTQIAVVTIGDTGGSDLADFADQLAEKWGVGEAGKENGVVVLINPGQGNKKGRVHISVGYGLEGVIPDITAKHIIDREIVPNFRDGRFYEGIDQATTVLMQLAAGEFPASDYNQTHEHSLIGLVIFVFIIVMFLLLVSRKRNVHYSPGKEIPFWTLLWLMSQGSHGNKGSWGDFTGGKGSFGGGGFGRGGGFGGFGGGRFGGGGAGGSW